MKERKKSGAILRFLFTVYKVIISISLKLILLLRTADGLLSTKEIRKAFLSFLPSPTFLDPSSFHG